MTTQPHPHGTFCWADLQTSSGTGAKAFYAGLLGWEMLDIPLPNDGVYRMAQHQGKNIVGIGELSAEQQASGIPSVWSSYVAVDDVDATAAKAAELGGTLIAPPFDVMDSGRMAIVQGPTGAIFGLWQAGSHRGADMFNVPPAMAWNELATRDTERAIAYYTTLFGWTVETNEIGYTFWKNNGRINGAMREIDANVPAQIPANWMTYFSVEDAGAVAGKAAELGGGVLVPPFPTGFGVATVLRDPQGAVFTAMKFNSPNTTMP